MISAEYDAEADALYVRLGSLRRGVDETIENVKDAISALFKGKPPSYTLEVKVLVPV